MCHTRNTVRLALVCNNLLPTVSNTDYDYPSPSERCHLCFMTPFKFCFLGQSQATTSTMTAPSTLRIWYIRHSAVTPMPNNWLYWTSPPTPHLKCPVYDGSTFLRTTRLMTTYDYFDNIIQLLSYFISSDSCYVLSHDSIR